MAGTGDGLKGEIEEGKLMMVRHAPGPKGPDVRIQFAQISGNLDYLQI